MIFNLTQPVLDSAPKFTYTGTYEYIDDGDGNWRIKFLTSGVFTPLRVMTIDAFLVGGGAGGKNNGTNAFGGGGGYTNTVKSIQLSANTNYNIIIGAGGAPGGNGGETSGFELTAAGGNGKDGGSGGGAPGIGPGDGGSDGSNGGSASGILGYETPGGTGQGTTTREFGESPGTLYSGGGGGGVQGNTLSKGGLGGGGAGSKSTGTPENGQENTGGGGGGIDSKSKSGGYGGSGIAIIRKHKEAAA